MASNPLVFGSTSLTAIYKVPNPSPAGLLGSACFRQQSCDSHLPYKSGEYLFVSVPSLGTLFIAPAKAASLVSLPSLGSVI